MKRITFIFIVAFAVLLFCGCSSQEQPKTAEKKPEETEPESNGETKKETVDFSPFLVEKDEENLICIEFINYDQWEEKDLLLAQELINSQFQIWFDERFQFSFSQQGIPENANPGNWERFGDLRMEITYRSEKVTSFVLEGMTNVRQAAHPMHSLTSYNFDSYGNPVLFEKLYPIDDELYDVFSMAGEAAIIEEAGGKWPETFESFSKTLCSRESFLKNLSNNAAEDPIYWYCTEEGVVFSYSVPFALGGHKEATVPYSYFDS
ncbi:MAG: hypothetical protein E7580_08950 [Ruminococcaceae bacterium]|nr:hypothetical protein [Oscillospiraceae bacterium]